MLGRENDMPDFFGFQSPFLDTCGIRAVSRQPGRVVGEVTLGPGHANSFGLGYPWPCFDWVILGLGADGHIASIFPDMITSNRMQYPVIIVSKSHLQHPSERITITPQVLNSAHQIIFLVSGSSKAEAVASTLNDSSKFPKLPAQLIQPYDGVVTWLLDREASQKLVIVKKPQSGKYIIFLSGLRDQIFSRILLIDYYSSQGGPYLT